MINKVLLFKILPFMRRYGQNILEPGRPHATIQRVRVTKATNTHSEYEILIPFPLQQRLHQRASLHCLSRSSIPAVLKCCQSSDTKQQILHTTAANKNSFCITNFTDASSRVFVARSYVTMLSSVESPSLKALCSCAVRFLRHAVQPASWFETRLSFVLAATAFCSGLIYPFKEETYLFYISTQSVPRCKHSPPRL